MVYVSKNSGSNFKSSTVAAGGSKSSSTGKPKVDALLSTGLFTPEDASKTKAIGSVTYTTDKDIPAGSRVYINLYENDKRKSERDPMFNLQIKQAPAKKS